MIAAKGVSKKYSRKVGGANFFYAVRDVDICLNKGELSVIVGKSGSGKTTLLNMMAGLLSPSEGSITLGGQDMYALGDGRLSVLRNEHIGVVPQGQSGLDNLTVLENVMLPCAIAGSSDQAEQRARDLIDELSIGDLADVRPKDLSGGEVRRLAIARALVMKPSVILADEPTGDLDEENTKAVMEIFRGQADNGAAVLLVTHETEALPYADRVYRMSAGQLQEEK